MDEQALLARLPASVAGRVQSIKQAQGTVTLVVDATGLDAATRDAIGTACRDILGEAEGVENVRVAMMADKVRRRIVAVGSGKGGVGKSTLTANLAAALHKMGRKVGLVDADIYGPSQPMLMSTGGAKPQAKNEQLLPVISPLGIPMLSMGHLVEPGKALAWRGPMAGNAFGQLVDADWGDTEILLLDLPPGTGDVQLSMLQKHKPDGAIIVSTPQDLALIDAQRAANLFDSGKVPIIGLVENMAGYACPHCGEVSDPFGRGGVEAAAEGTGIAFLGRIPLALAIRTASDAGEPPAAGDAPEGEAFTAIARQLAEWLDTPQGAGA
jgi:ATP-binding protein involved in chromosome partitioning